MRSLHISLRVWSEADAVDGFVVCQVLGRGRRWARVSGHWAETSGDRETQCFRGHILHMVNPIVGMSIKAGPQDRQCPCEAAADLLETSSCSAWLVEELAEKQALQNIVYLDGARRAVHRTGTPHRSDSRVHSKDRTSQHHAESRALQSHAN